MPKSIQINKEFVEAAGIAEQDAFIAVAIRRIVAQMAKITARELTAGIGTSCATGFEILGTAGSGTKPGRSRFNPAA